MAKFKKLISAMLCLAIIISVCAIGFVYPRINIDSSDFVSSLTSMTKKYDAGIDKSKLDGEFSLKRLIVTGFSGDTYNAADYVYDSEHDFAVLQYNSVDDAKKAYSQMKADNICVDADTCAKLDSFEKGEMHSIASDTIGTPSFLNKYKMGYDDVLVAVIDTGVMYDHPDLEGRFYSNGYDLTSDECDDAYYDTSLDTQYYLHSTFISGIIANNTADNVKIVPFKVVPFGADSSDLSAVITALNMAVDMGVSAVNISISSSYPSISYKRAIDNAVSKGVCICSSMGNDGAEVESYPSMYDGTIAVTALNRTCERIATYSNYGSYVDFSAPGSHIISTVPTENGAGYGEYSGTSFSTPYVVSACANIKSMNKNLTKNQVYDILCDFASDYGDKGYDKYYGNGVPNLSDIYYTDDISYSYYLPEGELEIYESRDYTSSNQPWKLFSEKIVEVTIDEMLDSIGSYEFYGMKNAKFNINSNYNTVGEGAFYGCSKLKSISFGIDVKSIGDKAFYGVDSNFKIYGYQNTPAQSYALADKIEFVSLGCKHNYSMDIIEPDGEIEGYTVYTCAVCKHSYIGAYVEPEVVAEGVCGENARYEFYNTGRLDITGSGEMYSYIDEKSPFDSFKNDVKNVYIRDEITSVSPFAFEGCNNIFQFHSTSSEIKVVDNCVYSADCRTLILAFGENYVMPELVENFNASAFVGFNSNIELNENFVVDNGIVYNKNNEVVMAMPNYQITALSISECSRIYDYAFILTQYPTTLRNYNIDLEIGDYAVGYSYKNGLVKNSFMLYGYKDTAAYQYAIDNDFNFSELNTGSCGDNIVWRFDLKTNELSLTGTGEMYKYKSDAEIPWHDYMSDIKSVNIGNEVEYLSVYSFFKASGIKQVTMPLSLKVTNSQTVWFGCSNIENIRLTLGTGVMPDYGTSNRQSTYTYTPWYISRNSLKNLIISSDVKYIGAYAFRECGAIKTLTLNDCDSIGKYAFYGATGMNVFINYSKDTEYLDNCFSSMDGTVVYAYDDSTSKDLAKKYSYGFISLGCDHSRGYHSYGERAECCFDSNVEYNCVDCDEFLYGEYVVAQGNGHYVKASVLNTSGMPINNAEVYIDGKLSAITNKYGRFTVDEVKCEESHVIEIKKHNQVIASVVAETNKKNRSGELKIQYGDFIADGCVNAKDYAFAHKNSFDDINLISYGKVESDFEINTEYSKQNIPTVTNIYNEQNESVSYRRDFYAEINLTHDFEVVECYFLYGKNMDNDFMCIENVGKRNADGFELKKSMLDNNTLTKRITYGSSSNDGVVSARIYIKYTNGVKDYVCYSDVTSYEY